MVVAEAFLLGGVSIEGWKDGWMKGKKERKQEGQMDGKERVRKGRTAQAGAPVMSTARAVLARKRMDGMEKRMLVLIWYFIWWLSEK